MPDLAGIRDALVTHLDSVWAYAPTIPVFYENTKEVDEDALGSTFLYCVVDFTNAHQINVSNTPDTRYSGDLILTVTTRSALGTRKVLELLSELSWQFGYKTLDGVHLGVPEVVHQKAPPGWYSKALQIPFFADTNT